MTTTKAVLDIQSDLDQPNAPSVATDVANKGYVDSVAGGVDATSASGGGIKGKATYDEDKGLLVAAGIAEVKVDTAAGVEFNGSGAIRAKVSPTEAIEFNGSGEIRTKIDGSSVTLNGSGQLAVPEAAAASGGGAKGLATYDSDKGIAVTSGVAEVKLDSTLHFDGLGRVGIVGAGGGGGAIGTVSQRAQVIRTITAITPATPITIGTGIDALSHPNGSITGQRIEVAVPPDYYTGTLDLRLTYRMSSAVGGPNNQVRLSLAAEIAQVTTGLIDFTSYPDTGQDLITPTNTDIVRQLVMSLTAGSFDTGATIAFYVKRLGTHANDLHTGALDIIAYEWAYTSIVDSRMATQTLDVLVAAPPEAATTPNTLGSGIDAWDFVTGTDNSLKGSFIVPENWDGVTDAIIYATYAMSSGSASVVRLETSGEIANVTTGAIDVVVAQNYDVGTTADTNVHKAAIRSIPASALQTGSHITAKLVRRVSVGSNHPGSFQLIGLSVAFSTAPVSGFTAITTEEHFIDEFGFNIITTDGVWGDSEYPSFATTFDQYVKMNSTVSSGRLDVAFSGRLMSAQATVAQVKMNIMGVGATPRHKLLIYAEGSGATAVYDSGLVPSPVAPTEYVITAAMMSAQPLVQKRFHVVVEAYIDSGEVVKCSLPFVRQE